MSVLIVWQVLVMRLAIGTFSIVWQSQMTLDINAGDIVSQGVGQVMYKMCARECKQPILRVGEPLTERRGARISQVISKRRCSLLMQPTDYYVEVSCRMLQWICRSTLAGQ